MNSCGNKEVLGERLCIAQAQGLDKFILSKKAGIAACRACAPQIYENLEDDRAFWHKEANTDYLTNLPNRRWLKTAFEACKSAWEEDEHFEFGIAQYDLEKFKTANDRRGQAFGDRVLNQAAKSLSMTRSSDLIFHLIDDRNGNTPENSSVARLGGDEFATIYILSSRDQAQQNDSDRRTKAHARPTEDILRPKLEVAHKRPITIFERSDIVTQFNRSENLPEGQQLGIRGNISVYTPEKTLEYMLNEANPKVISES